MEKELNEILIAESMAVNITDWPFLIVVMSLGVTIGIYISSQLKCHVRRNINNKELINNLNEKEKTKQ